MTESAFAGIELRVHGIGNHDALSAQGNGILIDGTGRGRSVDSYRAPNPPGHEVRFINWSRTSRSALTVLWYLAVPFTLLNVAGWMQSGRRPVRLVQCSLVVLWGALLTCITWMWAVVAVETVVTYVVADGELAVTVTRGAAIVIAFLLAGVIVVRTTATPGRRSESWLWASAALNWLGLGLALWYVLSTEPAQFTGRGTGCSIGWHDGDAHCLVYSHDVVTLAALLSMSVAVVLAVGAALASLALSERGWAGRTADPLLAFGVVLLLATTVLNVAWAALRGGIEWIVLVLVVDTNSGSHRSSPVHPVLLPVRDSSQVTGPDMVIGSLTLLVGIVIALVILRCLMRLARAVGRRREDRVDLDASSARHVHDAITAWSTRRLGGAIVGVLLLCAASVLGWLHHFDNYTLGKSSGGSPTTALLIQLTLVAILAFAFLPPLRMPLSFLGDLAGYWDQTFHPFAALPYRLRVIDAIEAELRRAPGPVVLVGHSQGSVIAFETVRNLVRAGHGAQLSLITCGSPLGSLYSRFFPVSFPERGRDEVAARLPWINFWRDTDPIATALGLPADGDRQLLDPQDVGGSRVLRRHGDYWLERQQRAAASRLLGGIDPGEA